MEPPIKQFFKLTHKFLRYIPEEYKPFKCDIKGRYKIVMSHDSSGDIATVRIFREDDENYSDYYLVDEGKDHITTYPILEKNRVMSGIN